MKFIDVEGQEGETLELKYCERCGGLWLRRRGAQSVHCNGCRARLAALLRGRRSGERVEAKPPRRIRVERLFGLAGQEVQP